MPNKQTFSIAPIKELLLNEITEGMIIDPFAYVGTLRTIFRNNEKIKIINNDLNPEYNTDFHMDAIDFLIQFPDDYADVVVYDPPYSLRQVSECYKGVGIEVTQQTTQASWRAKHLDEIQRILKVGGKAICFGWNTNGVGKKRGMRMDKILLIAHGGSKKDTICTVEIKER
jgi:hypothetical protein